MRASVLDSPIALVPAWMTGIQRFWAGRLALGLALGGMIALLEYAHYIPLVAESRRLGSAAGAVLLLAWCGEGVLLFVAVGLVECVCRPREPRAGPLALGVVAGAVGGVLLWQSLLQFVVRDVLGVALFPDRIGVASAWIAGTLYHVWMMLFFGGLAVAVHASERRRARMLATLRTAEIDRAVSRQRLAEMNLSALRTRVDPDFLLGALERFERLHEADPHEADRVLDDLIRFLRSAVADMRRTPPAAASNRFSMRSAGHDSSSTTTRGSS